MLPWPPPRPPGSAAVRPFHVLLVAHNFPPDGTAGVERYSERLARWMQGAGHHVTVLCPRFRPGRAQYGWCEEEVRGIRIQGLVQNWPVRPLPEAAVDPAVDRRVTELVGRLGCDVAAVQSVQGLGFGVVNALRRGGVPTVIHLHDAYWSCGRGGQRQRADGVNCEPVDRTICARCLAGWGTEAGPLERASLRLGAQLPRAVPPDLPWRLWRRAPTRARAALQSLNARLRPRRARVGNLPPSAIDERFSASQAALDDSRAVISPTAFLLDSLREDGLRVPRARVVETGVDLEGSGLPRETSPKRLLRIGFVGTWVPHKGPQVLAAALAQLDAADAGRIEAIAFGPAPRADWKQAVLQTAGGRLRDGGELDEHAARQTIASFDVLVAPSTWRENLPLVVLEARAAAVPILSSGLGGLADCVREGVDGWTIPPGDPSALAAWLRDAARAPERIRQRRATVRPPRSFQDFATEVEAIWGEARG